MGPRPRRGGLKGGRLASGPGTGRPSFSLTGQSNKKSHAGATSRWPSLRGSEGQSVAELPGTGFQPLIAPIHIPCRLRLSSLLSLNSEAGHRGFCPHPGLRPGAFCSQAVGSPSPAAAITHSGLNLAHNLHARGEGSWNLFMLPGRLSPFHHNFRGVDHGRRAGFALPGGAGVGLVFPLPDFPGQAFCRGGESGTGPASPGGRPAVAEVAGAGSQGPDLRGGESRSALPGPGARAHRGVRSGRRGAGGDALLLAEHPGSAAVPASGL